MMLNNFPNTFTVVQIHINDDYATTWGNTRANFYSVSGTPTAWFDGVLECVGAYTNVTQQYNWYKGKYDQRRATTTDVVIDLLAEETTPGVIQVTATVSREAGGGGAKNMRIQVVKLLDHWPAIGGYHRYGFREAASSVDISLNPGDSQVITRSFTLDSLEQSRMEDLRFVAWAQTPNAHSPADVFQAASTSLFNGPPEIYSVTPDHGTIAGYTSVTIAGANFGFGATVYFGGIEAISTTVADSSTLICTTPPGAVCGPVDVTVETPSGSATLSGGYSYVPILSVLGTPCIGCDLTISARGVPLGKWGVVKDDTLGPKFKKGIWWEIGFVNWEIVHNSWGGDGILNGLGQGGDSYTIPNDPGLIGTPLYFEGVFDGNGPDPGRNLILADLVTVIVTP